MKLTQDQHKKDTAQSQVRIQLSSYDQETQTELYLVSFAKQQAPSKCYQTNSAFLSGNNERNRSESPQTKAYQLSSPSKSKHSFINILTTPKKLSLSRHTLQTTRRKPQSYVRPRRLQYSPVKPKQCDEGFSEQFLLQGLSMSHKFLDKQFPAAGTMLGKTLQQKLKKYQFVRLAEYYQFPRIELIGQEQSSILLPRRLSNPTLMAALTLMSSCSHRLTKLFGSQSVNSQGIYYVNLCVDGMWRYVFVDDRVPVDGDQKGEMLVVTNGEELKKGGREVWSTLVEKAVAKLFGNYGELLNSKCGIEHFLDFLIGVPRKEYILKKNVQEHQQLIQKALQNEHIVIFEGSPQHNNSNSAQQYYHLTNIQSSKVILRNLSQPDQYLVLYFPQISIFQKLHVIYDNNSYIHVSYKLRHLKNYYAMVELFVNKATKCMLRVQGNSLSSYRDWEKGSCHEKEGRMRLVSQGDQKDIEQNQQLILEAGKYVLKIHQCQIKQEDFNLVYFGSEAIEMLRVKNMELWPHKCQCSPH